MADRATLNAAMGRRELMLGGLMLALTTAGLALRPVRSFARLAPDTLNRIIPQQIGGYSFASVDGLITAQTDDLTQRLYDQVLTRMYVAPGQSPIGLLIAYGSAEDEGLQLHRPDECYPAQGFVLSNMHRTPIALAGHAISATALTAARADRTEQLLFWTRIAGIFPSESRDERRAIVAENLRGRLPDGVLVRLSMTARDAVPATARLTQFSQALIGSLGAPARRLLMGQAG